MTDWWITPSGTTVRVGSSEEYVRDGDAGVHYSFAIDSTGGETREVHVRIDEPRYVNTLRAANSLPPLDEHGRGHAAWVAAVRAVDSNPGFFEGVEPVTVDLGYDDLTIGPPAPKIDDRALRRYIVRRSYLLWQNHCFDTFLQFDDRDADLTGAGPMDFLRNCQLLAQEGYIRLDRTHDPGFSGFDVRPTALLIREVERHGAVAADVESEEDYEARIHALRALSDEATDILRERQRYEAARTAGEVASVFRAVVPMLEGLVRRLLRERGSTREHSSLGPMIQELHERRIGSLGFRSQLSAVHTNGRDISLHGEDLPVAVLRIATEMCFELLPQTGQLFSSLA
jgi:hypothetical protein